jgi:hypothetical protein
MPARSTVPLVLKLLRGIGSVAAGLACLVGPSLLISRPLLEHLQTARAAAAPPVAITASQFQYLPWAGGRTVYVNQGNHGRRTHFRAWSQFGWDFALGYGVAVRVGDGTCARFEHLKTLDVSVDQVVGVGVQIGTAGSSGSSTGTHLHYQREDCHTGRSLPSSFVGTGTPVEGAYVTSAMPPLG